MTAGWRGPCPACGLPTGKRLYETSNYATVNYYICDLCGQVWTSDKYTGAIVRHIRPLTKKKRPPNAS